MSLKRNITIAHPYAAKLAEQGYRISIPSNSDLLPLVRAATPSVANMPVNASGDNALFSFLDEVAAEDNVPGFNEYLEIHGAQVDYLVPLVKGHIRIAQSVSRFIEETVTKVEGYKATIPDSTPLTRFNLIADPFCDVLDSDLVQDLITNDNTLDRTPDSILTTRPRTNEEIFQLLQGQDSEFDKQLVQAISMMETGDNGQPRNFLEEVFSAFFCGNATPSKNYDLRLASHIPSGERAIVALVIYLITEKFRESTPPDAVGALSQFRLNLEAMGFCAIRLLKAAVEEKKYQANNGLVILDMRVGENSLVVDKCSYDAYLEAGGLVEVILGSKVASLGLYTQEELIANADRCAQAWMSFASALRFSADNERQSYLVAIYKAVWAETASQKLDFEEDVRATDENLFSALTTEAYTWLDEQPVEVLDNPYAVLEHIFAKIRFHYTPAAFFLKEMKIAEKKEPEGDPRSHALAAATKYVASYLRTMSTLSHVHG